MLAQLMGVHGLLLFAHVMFLVGNGRQWDGSGLKSTSLNSNTMLISATFLYT